MKILLTTFLLLYFGVSNSQSFIDTRIYCAHHWADEKLRMAVGKQIFDQNFKFEKSKTFIDVYNENEEKLERLSLDDFRKSDYPATQLWLNYRVTDENLVLTELLVPFNLNCTTPWDSKGIKEILRPYLEVLENKTKVGLEEALQIARESGLDRVYYWDIDFEERRLVWTIKSEFENSQSKVIKINSRNGKILSEIIEVH